MKQIQIWSYLFCIITCFFTACEEEGPYINFEEEVEIVIPPTENSNPQKIVLLEEFTGVRCANCPAGTLLAEQLASEYEGQVIIVSIHSGFFSIPYPNAENFKIEAGVQIENLLSQAAVYPSAAISRQLFENETRRIITDNQWNNSIKAILAEPALASISVNTLDFDMEQLVLSTTVKFLESIESTVKLSVMLIEDNIISPQNVDGVKVDDYIHKHVLRTMLTPFNGILLDTSAEKDRTFQNEFALSDFEANWNVDNMHIVAFVHSSGSSLNVLNAIKTPLIE